MKIIYDKCFEEHQTGPNHPETPGRVRAIREGFAQAEVQFSPLPARSCSRDKLELVHSSGYIDRVEKFSAAEKPLNNDTPLCARSYEIALAAAGSALQLGEEALAGRNGFGFLRPPGHHAEKNQGMGFCLFNNIAVLAADLLGRGLKAAIVDIDVHHGNGTQEIFYREKDVYYLSFHQHPFYPGTGKEEERGAGDGKNTTLNIPLPAGAGWEKIEQSWRGQARPEVEEFNPDILLVSAGFDAHRDDPLGGLNLTDSDYLEFAGHLRKFAEENCSGRVVSLLEGGYNLTTLRRLAPKFAGELCGK